MLIARARQRGFTLVEVCVVVIITTVLGAIGWVSYRRYVSSSRVSEATLLTSNIRQAQEAYKSELGTYANVSSTIQSYYPAQNPGTFVTAWGGPCAGCISPDAWNQLPVRADAPVMFGYSTIAGVGGVAAAVAAGNVAAAPGAPNSMTMAVAAGASLGSTDPFYVVMAYGDTDGDGVPCTVLGYSFDNNLVVTAEGE